MLRSSSFSAFDMLRVCCCPHRSNPSRVARRMHDVHCGSSDGLVMDAMGRCGAAEALMARKLTSQA